MASDFHSVLGRICEKNHDLTHLLKPNETNNAEQLIRAIDDSPAIDKLEEFAEDVMSINTNMFNRFKPNCMEKNSSSFNRRKLVEESVKCWTGQNTLRATAAEFKNLLEPLFKATLQRWLIYEEITNSGDDGIEIQKLYDDYIKNLTKFIKRLINFFNKDTVSVEKWNQFCAKLGMKRLETKRKTIYTWIEMNGYRHATIDKLKEGLKAIRLRKGIIEIESEESELIPSMSSPIDNCLEKHWNNIVQALSPEQKQAIFGDLHCEDQEQAFNNIILKGNVGFHKFMKKLVEKVGSLSEFNEAYQRATRDDPLSLFTLSKVPKCIVPNAGFFESLAHYKTMKNWLQLFKVLIHANHMLDLLHYVSIYINDYVKKEPLTIVRFVDASSLFSFKKSICSFMCSLMDAGFKSDASEDDIKTQPIESLASILFKVDFHVFLVFYNCCKDILQKPGWAKFDEHDEMHLVFLTSAENVKKLDRFECHLLPELPEDKILEVLGCTQDQADAAREVCNFCGQSMLEVGIIRNFCHQDGTVFSKLQDLQEGLSLDSVKDDWNKFKMEQLEENLSRHFYSLVGIENDIDSSSEAEGKSEAYIEALTKHKEELNKYRSDFENQQKKTFERLEKQHEKKFADLETQHNEKFEDLEKQHQQRFEDMEKQYRKEFEDLAEELKSLRAKLEQVQKEKANTDKKIECLEERLASKMEENEQLQEDLQQYRKKCEEQAHYITLLEKKISELTAKFELRSCETQTNPT